jgi:hypothetical protein
MIMKKVRSKIKTEKRRRTQGVMAKEGEINGTTEKDRASLMGRFL